VSNSIEVTTRYATTASDLPAAWAFVMDRVDSVGPDPRITISPVWLPSEDPESHPRYFEVVVDGMVEA
jgi:hypothetical protein